MSVATYSETRVQNDILATTLAAISPEITNNALDHHVGSSLFFGRAGDQMFGRSNGEGRGKRFKTGESIEVRARLGLNANTKAMSSDYDNINLNREDNARMGRANWKLYTSSVVISGMERRNNRGEAAIVSLLEERTSDCIDGMVDRVSADVFNVAGASSDELTGIGQIIDSTSTLQSFSPTTYPVWASRGLSAKGTAPASINFAGGSFATTGIQNWRTAWINATEGAIMPQVLVTTDLVFAYYEGTIIPEYRTQSLRVGDLGFQQLAYKTAPVFHDPYCNSGVTYFLNFDYIEADVSNGADFDMDMMQRHESQEVFSAPLILQANLTCKGRKFENKVTSQTA